MALGPRGLPDIAWPPEMPERGPLGAGEGRVMPSRRVKAGTCHTCVTRHQGWCPHGSVFLVSEDTTEEEVPVRFKPDDYELSAKYPTPCPSTSSAI